MNAKLIISFMISFCRHDKDCISYMKVCIFNEGIIESEYNGNYMNRFDDCSLWWIQQK